MSNHRGSEPAVPSVNESSRLNPAQQQVLDELGSLDRPTFRDDLRDHLRHEIAKELDAIVSEVENPPLYVSKRKLSLIHGCEAKYVADEQSDFQWNIPAARGTVAHKAVELLIGRRVNPTPLDLVEDALARLEADNRSIGEFIGKLSEGERADLTSAVNDFVATFMDSFPPINRKWVPVTESRSRADFCDDQIALAGTVDLSLGRARGNEAGKVLIDLKTGRPHPSHIDDLRFYALLETLKIGIPPRLLVNYYLDAGQPRTEVVTEDLLWSTKQRVVDAVAKVLQLANGEREPNKSTGPGCRFCPALASCDEGTSHLARVDDDELPID